MGSYAGFSEFIIRIFSIVIFPITLAVHPILMNKWNKNKNIYELLIKLFKASMLQIIICVILLIPLFIFKDYFFYLIQGMIPGLDNSMKEIMIPIFIGGFLWQLALVLHKPLEIEERTLIMVVGCIMFSLTYKFNWKYIFFTKIWYFSYSLYNDFFCFNLYYIINFIFKIIS